MALDTFVCMFRRPFAWREYLLQTWFVARVSLLADDLPEVADLELNPVVASPRGAAVLGARIRLAPAPGRTDADTRRLTGS